VCLLCIGHSGGDWCEKRYHRDRRRCSIMGSDHGVRVLDHPIMGSECLIIGVGMETEFQGL